MEWPRLAAARPRAAESSGAELQRGSSSSQGSYRLVDSRQLRGGRLWACKAYTVLGPDAPPTGSASGVASAAGLQLAKPT